MLNTGTGLKYPETVRVDAMMDVPVLAARGHDSVSRPEQEPAKEPRMTSADPYDLDRFVAAQDAGGSYDRAVAELRRGRKTGHWIWFVFPQIAGLGQSAMSMRYSISSLDEARAYLRHPVLGSRLAECARIVEQTSGRSAGQIFGSLDAMKLRSSMTLFRLAAPDEPIFGQVLDKYFEGEPDPATCRLL